MPAPILVTAKELGSWLKCTYQTVQHLTEKGVIQKAKHEGGQTVKGRYDLKECVGAYIEHLRKRAGVKGEPGDDEAEKRWQSARTAKMEMAARREARKDALEEGRLVDPAEVRPVWTEYIGNCKAKLLALPIRCCNEIFVKQHSQAEVFEILTERVRDALVELKDYSEHYYGSG